MWSLTPREYAALRAVWMDDIERDRYHQATILAALRNGQFETDGIIWEAEDFLIEGNRAKRKQKMMTDRLKSFKTASSFGRNLDSAEVPDLFTDLGKSQGKHKLVN